MKLINRHGPCVGFTLFRFRKWNIELWYCPKNYSIEKHSHPKEKIELMFLFGKTTFYRSSMKFLGITEKVNVSLFDMFQFYTIHPNQTHWFTTTDKPLLFINFSTFVEGKPQSASEDFSLTN